jgi:protein SCO1/2
MCGCATANQHSQPASVPLAKSSPQASVYENAWTWRTDRDAPMKLSELKGRPVLVAMFFTTCAGTCGVTVNHLMQIQASLSAQERQKVDFVLVSFDSENDTPAALSRYRAERHLPADWTLLQGSAESTRALADQLDVAFAPDAARHILHGTQITLLDRNGCVEHRAVGTNADMDMLLGSIRAELAGTALSPQAASIPVVDSQDDNSCSCCHKK